MRTKTNGNRTVRHIQQIFNKDNLLTKKKIEQQIVNNFPSSYNYFIELVPCKFSQVMEWHTYEAQTFGFVGSTPTLTTKTFVKNTQL